MKDIANWFSSWSILWEFIEDQHLSRAVIDNLRSYINGPVLVIGAGQGLIVEYLTKKGFKVDGIDIDKEMIKMAKKRRNLNIIFADGRKLPFKDKSYKTVILASGVIDYLTDKKLMTQIIDEAIRVTGLHGNIFISFYQVHPNLEKMYKRIGVIDKNTQSYHMKRIFDIDRISKKNPLLCLGPIQEWTKKNIFWLLIEWAIIGLTLPKELEAEREKSEVLYKYAEEHEMNSDFIYDSIPETIPYRDVSDIKNLLNDLKYNYSEITKFDDCVMIRLSKSSFKGIKDENRIEIKSTKTNDDKNWIIKTENLTKKYKESKFNAIDNLNITIKKGSIFGLLGPNGAGKTTTLSILSGLLEASSGKIAFSKEIDIKNIKKILGYIPQDLALYNRLTAKENLFFFGKMYGIKTKELNIRINELLNLVGLENRADDFVKNYSTGMKRRLNMAIGLINDPKIILLDEPTVGIDPQSRNKIFDLVLSLKEQGITILYTTHYMEEAAKLCDTLAIIDYGKILLKGNPKDLVKKYGFTKMHFKLESKYSEGFINTLLKNKSVYDLGIKEKILIIESRNTDKVMEIIDTIKDIAKKYKVKISLIRIIEPNLESLFLDLTGRNLRDSLESSVIEVMV